MSNSKIWASSGVLYVSFFWNMLQYVLIFESILFTFTIIYINFILAGPTATVSLSPLSSLSPYLLHRNVSALSLSLHFFALSLSTPRHCLPFQQNSSRSIKPCHATPHKPDLHSQIAVHQHSHTNLIYALRSPSTNTATQTRSTLSDRRPPTQPHKPDPPHPQQPMAWSTCHAMPPSLSCHPPRYRNLPPSDFS